MDRNGRPRRRPQVWRVSLAVVAQLPHRRAITLSVTFRVSSARRSCPRREAISVAPSPRQRWPGCKAVRFRAAHPHPAEHGQHERRTGVPCRAAEDQLRGPAIPSRDRRVGAGAGAASRNGRRAGAASRRDRATAGLDVVAGHGAAAVARTPPSPPPAGGVTAAAAKIASGRSRRKVFSRIDDDVLSTCSTPRSW